MGGKSRKTGGISKKLIDKIRSGVKLGKGKKDNKKKEGSDPFGLNL